jgi:hypothetical protein
MERPFVLLVCPEDVELVHFRNMCNGCKIPLETSGYAVRLCDTCFEKYQECSAFERFKDWKDFNVELNISTGFQARSDILGNED